MKGQIQKTIEDAFDAARRAFFSGEGAEVSTSNGYTRFTQVKSHDEPLASAEGPKKTVNKEIGARR